MDVLILNKNIIYTYCLLSYHIFKVDVVAIIEVKYEIQLKCIFT